MDTRSARQVTAPAGVSRGDTGFATVQYVAVVGLSMILLVLVANLLVDMYARGAIRDALDEGVRAAAPVGAELRDCEERANEVLDGLLRGPLGDDVRVSCSRDGESVIARADGRLASWLPFLVPAWNISFEATMRAET
jgi:hypothetical protein